MGLHGYRERLNFTLLILQELELRVTDEEERKKKEREEEEEPEENKEGNSKTPFSLTPLQVIRSSSMDLCQVRPHHFLQGRFRNNFFSEFGTKLFQKGTNF